MGGKERVLSSRIPRLRDEGSPKRVMDYTVDVA